MLYFQLYSLNSSIIDDNFLVPTYLSEYEYKDSQQVYDTINRTYPHYVDIDNVTDIVSQLDYKLIFNCYWIDNYNNVHCDMIAVKIIAYE